MGVLRSLRNIGPKSERLLNLVGIHHLDDIQALGSVVTYLRLKNHFPEEVSLNMLYALQGALLDIAWMDLPEKMKEELRKEAGS
jgi:DNA transformation protein